MFKEHGQLVRISNSLQALETSHKQYSQLLGSYMLLSFKITTEYSTEDKGYLEEAQRVMKASYDEALELELEVLMFVFLGEIKIIKILGVMKQIQVDAI